MTAVPSRSSSFLPVPLLLPFSLSPSEALFSSPIASLLPLLVNIPVVSLQYTLTINPLQSSSSSSSFVVVSRPLLLSLLYKLS